MVVVFVVVNAGAGGTWVGDDVDPYCLDAERRCCVRSARCVGTGDCMRDGEEGGVGFGGVALLEMRLSSLSAYTG